MNEILDLAFLMLASPRQALMKVTNEERLKEGFLLWAFVILVQSISSLGDGSGLISQFLIIFVLLGTALLIHSAVIDYISGLWGGMGTAKGITAGFMASSVPLAFSVFFSFFDILGSTFLSGLISFAIVCWSFYLDVLAISENYRFRMGKACIIALMPYVMAAAFFISLAVIGVIAAASGISHMQDVQNMGAFLSQM